MRVYRDNDISKMVYDIVSGEIYTTKDKDSVIGTLLGSCVSVCFYDPVKSVIGMNHFVWPKPKDLAKITNPLSYGDISCASVLERMMCLGTDIRDVRAKVFGGAKQYQSNTYDPGQNNSEFILTYLREKGIPIVAMEVGGEFGRRIFFHSSKGEVWMKRIIRAESDWVIF
jgi:chemotaxis protein CheD